MDTLESTGTNLSFALSQIKSGYKVAILGYTDTNTATAAKLTSMGFLPGVEIEVVRSGPFGSGLYVKLNGANRVGLREEEAAAILVSEPVKIEKHTSKQWFR